jgi:hypothetical protein
MGDSPDPDTLREWIAERDFTRREVLTAIAAVTGSGWVFRDQFPTAGNTDARLTEAEESAESVAERLEVTDLRDPLMMSGLTPAVERTIETINEVLHDGTVTKGVWIAEQQRQLTSILSIIPGIASPPAHSQPAKRLARLEAVLSYYRNLDVVLEHAASTQRILKAIETPALFYGERPEEALSSLVDTAAIEAKNKNTRRTGERVASDISEDRLLPATEEVAAQISLQVRVQHQHSTAIQSYLNSASHFEDGARQHEQGNLDQAESEFRAAKEAIPAELLESGFSYSISTHGPTLHDYATHFTKRRQGITQLIGACESEIDSSKQNSRFNKGLSHLIDARGVISQ